MRALKFGALAASFGMFLALLSTIGCGSTTTTGPTPPKKGGGDADADKPKTAVKKGTATITGKVTYDGPAIDHKELDKVVTEGLKDKTADEKAHCLAAKDPYEKGNPLWKINDKTKEVQYAVVFLKPESDAFYFECSKDDPAYKDKAKDFDLRQPFCAFEPNSLVLFTKYRKEGNVLESTGVNLIIHNDTNANGNKGIGHNSKIMSPDNKEITNQAIEAGKSFTQKGADLLPDDNRPYSVSCAAHTWMAANLWVLDHPYYDVTKEDGSFTIKNAPAGKVRIVAWHKGADKGFITGKEGKEIKTEDGKELKDQNFVIKK